MIRTRRGGLRSIQPEPIPDKRFQEMPAFFATKEVSRLTVQKADVVARGEVR